VSYIEREVGWEAEGSVNVFNYVLSFDATSVETLLDEDILSSARDEYVRADLQREITGRLEAELLSAKFFRYILGGKPLPSATVDPYSIKPANNLTTFDLKHRLKGPKETIEANYSGCKVDTCRINLEVGEDVTYEIGFVAQWSTISTSASLTGIDPSIKPYVFHNGMLILDNSTVSYLQSCVIEISNNLTARYTADSSQKRDPYIIEEGILGVSGRFTVGEALTSKIEDVITGNTYDLELELTKNTEKIEMFIKNCRSIEWADTDRGREPYQIEFPFMALPSAGLDVFIIKQTGHKWTISPT